MVDDYSQTPYLNFRSHMSPLAVVLDSRRTDPCSITMKQGTPIFPRSSSCTSPR
jgi:hypothetical protein